MVTSKDVLTEEAVRQRVEEVVQESLQFRRAFRDLDATSINDSSFNIPQPDDTIGEPEAIPEGAEFPRDEESYSKVTINFEKYGFETAITREAASNSMIDVAADNVERQARQMAEFLNSTAWNELSGNLNTDSPVGDNDSTLSFSDIVTGKRHLREDNYSPDLLIVNAQGEADLLTSSEFTRATDLGDETITEGRLGRVAGLDVFVDTDGHLSSSEGDAVLVDTTYYGYEAVREPVNTNEYEAPERQADIMQIWTRRGFKAIDSGAAIRIDA